MTAVTAMVRTAWVEFPVADPLSVPRTVMFTLPKKLAAGVKTNSPEPLITAVPWAAVGPETIPSVTIWPDSSDGPGEKICDGVIVTAVSSAVLKDVLTIIGASLTAFTVTTTLAVASMFEVLRILYVKTAWPLKLAAGVKRRLFAVPPASKVTVPPVAGWVTETIPKSLLSLSVSLEVTTNEVMPASSLIV